MIDTRLARLGEEAQRLLAVAAVIGRTVPLDLWQTVAEADEDALLDLIEHAGEARVLMETTEGESVRFLTAMELQCLAAWLALDEGDLAAAHRWLEAHNCWLEWEGPETLWGRADGHHAWAKCHRAAGDAKQADEHAQAALAHATAPRQPLALLAAHRRLGELATKAGRHEDGDAHLQASLDLADACHAPYERALTLLAVAESRAASGETETARTLLDETRAICEPLGAKPVLAQAGALAVRLTLA